MTTFVTVIKFSNVAFLIIRHCTTIKSDVHRLFGWKDEIVHKTIHFH